MNHCFLRRGDQVTKLILQIEPAATSSPFLDRANKVVVLSWYSSAQFRFPCNFFSKEFATVGFDAFAKETPSSVGNASTDTERKQMNLTILPIVLGRIIYLVYIRAI